MSWHTTKNKRRNDLFWRCLRSPYRAAKQNCTKSTWQRFKLWMWNQQLRNWSKTVKRQSQHTLILVRQSWSSHEEGVTRNTKCVELRQLFVHGGQWNIASDKGGNIVKPSWHYHEVCEFKNHSTTISCCWITTHEVWTCDSCHQMCIIRVGWSFETKAHKTRAMTMKIVNDDEIQSVHDFQTVSEKVSIINLLKELRIGIPHDTQVKMTRVWEEHERFTPNKQRLSDSTVVRQGNQVRWTQIGRVLEEGEILRATPSDNLRQSVTEEHQDGEGWKANERVRLRSAGLITIMMTKSRSWWAITRTWYFTGTTKQ